MRLHPTAGLGTRFALGVRVQVIDRAAPALLGGRPIHRQDRRGSSSAWVAGRPTLRQRARASAPADERARRAAAGWPCGLFTPFEPKDKRPHN
jgi:hypothetical protein